ncbi:hypothetical protein [Nocardia wallacei]|uniref:Uncharacterized protein n=1 Tax=Nocardia wallacei TaxID=480035 RepID=A0A7G1KFT8_9NOCA|nr:hypothetical protein [Nocardia wallacei]BCK53416.1 hypothetical protein NWFMUON74_11880 [Nocardia wallacei]
MNWWRKDTAGQTVDDIQERLAREHQTVGWAHQAPAEPLTTSHAHRIMQQHRDCPVQDCPRKSAAWYTLVRAGKIKPDSGRNY